VKARRFLLGRSAPRACWIVVDLLCRLQPQNTAAMVASPAKILGVQNGRLPVLK